MTTNNQKQNRFITISVPSELEQFIIELTESGQFLSASEVVCESLRLLQERHIVYQARLSELQKEITIGVEAADRGELVDGEEVIKLLLEENRLKQVKL